MSRFFYVLVVVIALGAVYGTFGLVEQEFSVGDICPKILKIPACYIVFVCFLSALVFHLSKLKKRQLYYFVSIGLVTLIALTGTIGELTGTTECPKTSGGIPMCFISLGICISLLLSKVANLRSRRA